MFGRDLGRAFPTFNIQGLPKFSLGQVLKQIPLFCRQLQLLEPFLTVPRGNEQRRQEASKTWKVADVIMEQAHAKVGVEIFRVRTL